MTLATFLSYWSGLAFVAPELPWPTLVGTVLGLHTCDAIMCRLFAHNGGYPKNTWTIIRVIGGPSARARPPPLPPRGRAPPPAPPRPPPLPPPPPPPPPTPRPNPVVLL